MNQHVRDTGHFVVEEAKKLLARGLIWAALAVIVFAITPLWSRIQSVWHSVEEIAAIRTDLQNMQEQLTVLSEGVARATGEDRVIRQIPGLSYVKEPVHVGDEVVLYLVVQRTRLGALCKFVEGTPLFTDETGITSAGNPIQAARQIGTEATRLRLNLTPPKNLRPGRVELYLALEYDCGGVRTPEKTDPVAFNLLPQDAK
jgi:hypothetical protein